MSSTNRSALSRLEDASRDLEEPVLNLLGSLCEEPPLHARFLNTLSQMEHIGSRKIMASQSPRHPAQDTLKHLAEETRHAFFFKRAAEKLAGHSLSYDAAETLSGISGALYMGRLDAHISAAIPDKRLPYLYMSLIVELRAIWFYRLYRLVLTERAVPINLASVVAEEEAHLDEMSASVAAKDAESENRIEDFRRFEDGRFRALWRAIEQAADDQARLKSAS